MRNELAKLACRGAVNNKRAAKQPKQPIEDMAGLFRTSIPLLPHLNSLDNAQEGKIQTS